MTRDGRDLFCVTWAVADVGWHVLQLRLAVGFDDAAAAVAVSDALQAADLPSPLHHPQTQLSLLLLCCLLLLLLSAFAAACGQPRMGATAPQSAAADYC